MRTPKRRSNLRRYYNLPSDAVLALLAQDRDEESLFTTFSRRRRPR
jgi:hypothetical protein